MSEFPHSRETSGGDIVPYDDNPDDARVFYAAPDTSEYMLTTADAASVAQSFIEAPSAIKPEVVTSSEVPPYERLATIEKRFKFHPRSLREMSDTYDLTGKELLAGAATHLNRVLLRQKGYEVNDPPATVRAIVTRYADYATKAQREAYFLNELTEMVSDESGRIASLSRLGTDWRYAEAIARPLLHATWTNDVQQYIATAEGENPLKTLEDKQSYSASNRTLTETIQRAISGQGVKKLIDGILTARQSEQHRYDFWVEALQQSRQHQAARGVAYEALKNLGVIENDS